ncbi:MAG: hypothetical protein HWN51_03565 [Desulfobacterales bacterium]|nr:hypothetical protein [Desulfobacterales bacterium]
MQRRGSIISAIFSSYRRALGLSQERYTQLYTERAANVIAFYEDFLKDLIIGFNGFREASLRRKIRREVEAFFDRDEIQFVAIDGTCKKDPFTDFMVFSSIAYGVRGEISLQGDPPTLQYKRRTMDEDISFVAYVPVPFAEIADVTDQERLEDFVVTDQDRVDLSSIHNTLMQLAEVYLAYEMARSTAPDRPRLILMDHSPSSIMASTDVGRKRIGLARAPDLDTRGIGLLGYGVGRRVLDEGDAIVAYAHPFNDELQIPSTKRFRLYNALIAEAVRNRGKPIDVAQFSARNDLTVEEIESHFKRNSRVVTCIAEYDRVSKIFRPRFDFQASWWDSVRLFEDICRRLFREKDQEALIYDALDEDDPTKTRRRWMSPDDVKFLVAIGLRALIEECWKNRVMLLGIVKDSQSRYFTRNYYGMMRYVSIYDPIDVKPLPWTDRIVLEDIAYQMPEISVPWSTIEFDSCFMTLHLGRPEGETEAKPMGVQGDVINQERLFARSLGQFFLRRRSDKAAPLMGHVIFIDRLLHPHWDVELCEDTEIKAKELGAIRPFLHRDSTVDNPGQRVAIYFLDTLTRNLFPEAIGYPDPLHKADWGAKTVGRRVAQIIADSEISFRANPLTKALRAIRDEIKR